MLLHHEGFETRRVGTYLSRSYDTVAGTATYPTGRKGGFAARSINLSLTKVLVSGATWIVGLGFRTTGLVSGSSSVGVTLSDSIGSQVEFTIQPATGTPGQFVIEVRRGATVLDTTIELQPGAWHYLEFKAVIHATTGEYEVVLDGNSLISDTNVNTSNQGSGEADRVTISWIGSVSCDIDDIYVCDNLGGVADDFLGDVLTLGSLPAAEGNQNDFIPSTGSNNAALVDDPATTPDDTDYVSADAIGAIDLYDYAALTRLGANSTVVGVLLTSTLSILASGSRTVRTRVRSGGSEAFGGSVVVSGAIIRSHSEVFIENPVSTDPWTKATLEAAELGVEIEA